MSRIQPDNKPTGYDQFSKAKDQRPVTSMKMSSHPPVYSGLSNSMRRNYEELGVGQVRLFLMPRGKVAVNLMLLSVLHHGWFHISKPSFAWCASVPIYLAGQVNQCLISITTSSSYIDGGKWSISIWIKASYSLIWRPVRIRYNDNYSSLTSEKAGRSFPSQPACWSFLSFKRRSNIVVCGVVGHPPSALCDLKAQL
jgi:hypothetical protein